MSLEKIEQKAIDNAAALVVQLQKSISRNQKAIQRKREEIEELIAETESLSKQLAGAQEYLDDLTKAKSD